MQKIEEIIRKAQPLEPPTLNKDNNILSAAHTPFILQPLSPAEKQCYEDKNINFVVPRSFQAPGSNRFGGYDRTDNLSARNDFTTRNDFLTRNDFTSRNDFLTRNYNSSAQNYNSSARFEKDHGEFRSGVGRTGDCRFGKKDFKWNVEIDMKCEGDFDADGNFILIQPEGPKEPVRDVLWYVKDRNSVNGPYTSDEMVLKMEIDELKDSFVRRASDVVFVEFCGVKRSYDNPFKEGVLEEYLTRVREGKIGAEKLDEKLDKKLDLDVITDKISKNDDKISKNDDKISKNDDKVGKNDLTVDKNDVKIINNKVTVAKNNDKISKNEHTVGKNDAKIINNKVIVDKNEYKADKNEIIASKTILLNKAIDDNRKKNVKESKFNDIKYIASKGKNTLQDNKSINNIQNINCKDTNKQEDIENMSTDKKEKILEQDENENKIDKVQTANKTYNEKVKKPLSIEKEKQQIYYKKENINKTTESTKFNEDKNKMQNKNSKTTISENNKEEGNFSLNEIKDVLEKPSIEHKKNTANEKIAYNTAFKKEQFKATNKEYKKDAGIVPKRDANQIYNKEAYKSRQPYRKYFDLTDDEKEKITFKCTRSSSFLKNRECKIDIVDLVSKFKGRFKIEAINIVEENSGMERIECEDFMEIFIDECKMKILKDVDADGFVSLKKPLKKYSK